MPLHEGARQVRDNRHYYPMLIFLSATPREGRSAGRCKNAGWVRRLLLRLVTSAPGEASGSRPPQLRGAAFNGWTGTGEGRRKLPRWGGRRVLRLVPGSTAPGTEKPQVERRKATRSRIRARPAEAREGGGGRQVLRLPALRLPRIIRRDPRAETITHARRSHAPIEQTRFQAQTR